MGKTVPAKSDVCALAANGGCIRYADSANWIAQRSLKTQLAILLFTRPTFLHSLQALPRRYEWKERLHVCTLLMDSNQMRQAITQELRPSL